jgi:predicted anti-sigma-YlaC factor YlaD
MTCREVVDFLTEYLEGALPSEQQRLFTTHLDACRDCVTYVKSYEEAVRLGKTALSRTDEPATPDVPEELVQGILAARRKSVR